MRYLVAYLVGLVVMLGLCFFWAMFVVPLVVPDGGWAAIILGAGGGFFIGWAVASVALEFIDW
jgi:hypothetical protein